MELAISGLYIALTALIALALGYQVVARRRKFRIGVGDGDNKEMRLHIRSHANLIEYAPFVLLMLVSAEAQGTSPLWLHAIGSAWIIARVLHPIGLVQGRGAVHFGRFWGTLLTWIILVVLAGLNIVNFVASAFAG
ncbi:MAPEG family protein [Paraferrimonas sedimenticola]|uniref:Glutathione S-transferase n=1 Tax=Paraferrimonas sedimenticola TaxID=375674 RepID=A0AA37W0N3_9GAMM|nr:MAPEG family protein [Paraferrimonas sedimenticola]GLP95262.1 glutathione S-transferase [Paraferrimonas sedimenticola]